MPDNECNLQRALLFELLRQKNASDSAAARVRAREFVQAHVEQHVEQEDQVMIQARAVQSWGTRRRNETSVVSLGNRWLPRISRSYRRAKPVA